MRIGIEAQRIQRRKKHGMDIVAMEYIRGLEKIDKENEYFIFVNPDEDKTPVVSAPNFHLVELRSGPYPVWEQVYLPKAAVDYKLDVLHCTSNTAPLKVKTPLVTTIHDIIYLESVNLKAGTYYQRLGNLYRRWNVPKIAHRSDKVITVSHFEEQNIIARFPELQSKLEVVYNAAGAHFQVLEDSETLAFAQTHQLPDQFIFFIGNTDPKKNVPNTLKAYAIYRRSHNDALPLVMPDLDKEYLKRVLEEIGEPNLMQFIQLTGYIPNAELPCMYNLATLFLYTSKRESFGIPVLEAFQCGAPVVGSNVSSIPEVAGDCAFLCDPHDPQSIADAIAELLNNENLRYNLIRDALIRAKEFSWEQSARQLLQIYQAFDPA